jgi:MOSC domain-containing protein YiiM
MNQPDPTVLSLQLGKARDISSTGGGAWWDKDWSTGFYKTSVDQPCWLGYEGFRGDEQADRRFHGGPEKAVCVYSAAHYEYWREHLALPDLPYGAFGENLTVGGLTEPDLSIGDIFALGEARIQVSQPRQPCWKLARRWKVKDLAAQVERNGFTGWYFRVLHHGWVRAGDSLRLDERPFPQWTIQRCNEIMHHEAGGREAAAALASCPLLSSSWKDSLWAWAQRPDPGQNSRAARTTQPS